jgi:hypothetical protein
MCRFGTLTTKTGALVASHPSRYANFGGLSVGKVGNDATRLEAERVGDIQKFDNVQTPFTTLKLKTRTIGAVRAFLRAPPASVQHDAARR